MININGNYFWDLNGFMIMIINQSMDYVFNEQLQLSQQREMYDELLKGDVDYIQQQDLEHLFYFFISILPRVHTIKNYKSSFSWVMIWMYAIRSNKVVDLVMNWLLIDYIVTEEQLNENATKSLLRYWN